MSHRPAGTIVEAAIDACVLFSCLVANYNRALRSQGRVRQHSEGLSLLLRRETAQVRLLESIGTIRRKVTTSHAIAELRGLQSARLRLRGRELESFWTCSIDLLRQWSVDEHLVRLLELADEDDLASMLGRIGHPDTGLIKLALDRGCILITEDARTMYAEALRLGVKCTLLTDLIPRDL